MRKGFTLVELSIVLVIIGLLIGGILAAQSMIHTAKVNKAVRAISQYDAILANFKTKYNQSPGDSNLVEPRGNNDGLVLGGETIDAWTQFSNAMGLKAANGQSYVAGAWNNRNATNCPVLDFPQEQSEASCITFQGHIPNYLIFYNRVGDLGLPATKDPFRPYDIAPIDTKLDDGNADTGIFRAYEYGTDTTVGDCKLGGGRYNVSNNTKFACTIFWDTGIATGYDITK